MGTVSAPIIFNKEYYFVSQHFQSSVSQFETRNHWADSSQILFQCTVKTLYNVTSYNRIFNIRHKIAGNRSVSIKIPSS